MPQNETIKSQNETINGSNETVNQIYLQIIVCVAENDNVKSQLLLEYTGVSRATLFRAITYLASDDIHFLMRQGARRNGCYVLTEEGQMFYDEVIKSTRAHLYMVYRNSLNVH